MDHLMVSSEPLPIGGSRQLFLDDTLLAEQRQAVVVLQRPDIQHENLLQRDRPWESGRIGLWGSIVPDGRVYRLWYEAFEWDAIKRTLDTASMGLCHAESRDGVHFEKPELGLFPMNGEIRTNVVMPDFEGDVFVDPHDVPEKRFKAIGKRRRMHASQTRWDVLNRIQPLTTWVFTSPDGIHWRISDRPVLPMWLGCTQSAVWDPGLGKWVLYLRAHLPQRGIYGDSRRAYARTTVALGELDRPYPFPGLPGVDYPRQGERPGPALSTEFPIALDIAPDEHPGTQICTMNATRDPGGKAWGPRVEVVKPGQLGADTCSYCSLLPLSNDTALIAYSEFNVPGPDGPPRKSIRVRRVVTRQKDAP